MRLGRASGYGLLAMMFVAEHSQSNDGAFPCAREIAHGTGVPVEYLRKILQRLVRARLIRGERGRTGGFALARSSSRVNVLQIVEAIEGPLDEQSFLHDELTSRRRGNGHGRLWQLRRDAAACLRDQFVHVSLAQIVGRHPEPATRRTARTRSLPD
ncbi:MAG: RrF2 family transcriptional regulator [Tepidisphaeraceae bacterium]